MVFLINKSSSRDVLVLGFEISTVCSRTHRKKMTTLKPFEYKDGKENLGWVRDTLYAFVSTESLVQRVSDILSKRRSKEYP